MTIEFTDSEYRFSNGHAPKGRGMWGFEFEGMEFWHSGTLTECKKACRSYVRQVAPKGFCGTVYVKVLP